VNLRRLLPEWHSAFICLLFFASGSAGVIFETLWFHQARLVLGSSVWAAALVPAAFMGGLAVGNGLAMRFGDRVRNSLRAYAVIEMVVGVSGVLLVHGLPRLSSVLAGVARPLLDHTLQLALVRLGIGFALLLAPSTAMGLTLPLLVRALSDADANFGRVLGRLYGWNTLGAVAGALLSELCLVGVLGLGRTSLVSGALNLVAGAAAFFLSRSGGAAAVAPRPESRAHGQSWRLLVVAFLAGAALLALEVVWIRFLSLYLMTVSLAFAIMLAIVLAGIALGGLTASHWLRARPGAHRFVAHALFAAAVLTVLTYALFPVVRESLHFTVAREPSQMVALGLPLMFPVSFASGMTFTLLGAAVRTEVHADAGAAAVLTLYNTAGAGVGALAAGALLLPVLGMERSFFALSVVYGCCGALLVARNAEGSTARKVAWIFGAASIVAWAFFPFGAMKRVHFAVPLSRWTSETAPHVEVREGLSETILYLERTFAGHTRSQRMITNGISMSASDYRNRRYMKLFVYWPIALHENPKQALLICFGVGATAKALTESHELESIDVVDVSRDVLEMSRVVFPDPQQNPLHDPRVRTHVEDGRFFLQATDKRFDIITGEPPPPDLDGVESLYSVEYFRLLRSRLREGGIATYWLPTHSLAEGSALSVVRAFCDAFDDCSLWNGYGTDLILIGTNGLQRGSTEQRFRAQWADPRIADELDAIGLERPEELGALFIGDSTYLRELTSRSKPVADDFPRRIASPARFAAFNESGIGLYGGWSDREGPRARFEASNLISRLWPPAMKTASLAHFESQALLNRFSLTNLGRLSENLPRAHEFLTLSERRGPVLWTLGSDSDVVRILKTLTPSELAVPGVAHHVGIWHISERKFAAAAAQLKIAEGDPAVAPSAAALRVYALFMAGQTAEARSALASARERFPLSRSLLGWIETTFPVPGTSSEKVP
jgi:spermidine synthase